MIRNFFILLLAIMAASQSAWAAKAGGNVFAARQQDGTTLMVRLMGDEHQNWYQTMDGVLLKHHGGSFYVAKTTDDGQLVSTGILAHNIDTRDNAEAVAAKSQKRELFFAKHDVQSLASRGSGYPQSNKCPHMGKVKIPVIMMDYPDLKFAHDKEETMRIFNEFYNGMGRNIYSDDTSVLIQGYGSVKQYFLDASNGLFEPEFVLYGPYTADYESQHYGNNKGLSASDLLKKEAIAKADNDIDFRLYDSDNNGCADLVYVLYAGNGANIGKHPTAIWPHCSTSMSYRADGKTINIVGMSNELTDNPFGTNSIVAGIGVFCHEMSHGLGLPDLYWSTDESRYWDNCGPEEWDIMDGSENICNGIWPTQYAAWEKEAMGWLQLERLKDPKFVTVYPLNDPQGRGKAYMVKNPADLDEYYVIENFMSSEDSWNYYHWYHNLHLSSNEPGLIITHINSASRASKTLTPNAAHAGMPLITLLPADGFILGYYSINEYRNYKGSKQYITWDMYRADEAGDVYPGPNNVKEILHYGNYKDVTDMGVRYPIKDIRINADRSISFSFNGGIDDGIDNIATDCASADKVYSLNGQCLGNDINSLPKGIYIVNGKKVRNQ